MTDQPAPLALDASAAPRPAVANCFRMGASLRPDGQTLEIDSRSLLLNRKRWLPVMGEFQYARYPEHEWRDELLKMKAGGLSIVASYVFWIHHEETEGQFDWSGQRSLREFVSLCRSLGLWFMLRCGPWCHGECRNGGLPDWIEHAPNLKHRSDDPVYLQKVQRLYQEIALQLKGLLWKDGGPVIGMQLENEYGGPGEHLMSLKRIALEAGLDVPLVTRTGWPDLQTPIPFGEMIPLFGGYPDAFWDRSTDEIPGGQRYMFTRQRTDDLIATDILGKRKTVDASDTGRYPFCCCEIGAGLQTSYHRRIHIAPADIAALAMIKLGSGNNLQGYYVYHGGTNPEGRTPLNESQETGYANDLPVKTYDFQTALGEFGQMREHYHSLRLLHLFLADFGAELAAMPMHLPEKLPAGANDTSTVRWAVRSDSRRGCLFVNNYERLTPLPAKHGVQFAVRLSRGELRIPSLPVTLPADSHFFWPFYMDLGGADLIYATAQPVCRLSDGQTTYVVFAETPGIAAEFVIAASGVEVESTAGPWTKDQDIRIRPAKPGLGAAAMLRTPEGKRIAIILLDPAQALGCWKETFQGRERLFLTHAGLVLDGSTIRLRSEDPAQLSVAVLPAPARLELDGMEVKPVTDGLFQRFGAQPTPTRQPALAVGCRQIAPAGPAREVVPGPAGVAQMPSDEDFHSAAVWQITLPDTIERASNPMLRIYYVGDVARVLLDGKLIGDDFYNGKPLEIGLSRFAPEVYRNQLHLHILPLRKDAPIYLPKSAWPSFGASHSIAAITRIELIEQHEARFGWSAAVYSSSRRE